MQCPVCDTIMRETDEEVDGPGGPFPTGEVSLFCPGCQLTISGSSSVIQTFKGKAGCGETPSGLYVEAPATSAEAPKSEPSDSVPAGAIPANSFLDETAKAGIRFEDDLEKILTTLQKTRTDIWPVKRAVVDLIALFIAREKDNKEEQ